MTKRRAPRCSFPGCNRTTKDPRGRCTYHRSDAPPPADGSWTSGLGLVHPTGGYDEVGTHNGHTRYLRDGAHHRLDGPAHTHHRKPYLNYGVGGRAASTREKMLVLEEWFVEGKLSRTDGPAKTRWDPESPGKAHVAYYLDGDLHRLDGPALVDRDQWGKVRKKVFAIHGHPVPEEGFTETVEAFLGGAPLEWAVSFGNAPVSG